MIKVTADQLIFINETLIKKQTGWRSITYSLINSPVHWHNDIWKGETWSILLIYTINDYLLNVSIKQEFFNLDLFFKWVTDNLLSHFTPFLKPQSIVIFNNLNLHLDLWVKKVIKMHKCFIKFLFLYSSDYNSIKLSFNIMKLWLWQYMKTLQQQYKEDFKGLLQFVINENYCDWFVIEHFKHNADEYMFKKNYKTF